MAKEEDWDAEYLNSDSDGELQQQYNQTQCANCLTDNETDDPDEEEDDPDEEEEGDHSDNEGMYVCTF